MNKVLNINLGGIPFTIDEDAYDHLHAYLTTIHNHFRSSEGYEEITADIEARMAELFQEKLGNRPIVTLVDVKNVIAIMGTPEDFGAEPLGEEAPKSDSQKQWKIKTGKRLFRNPDDKVAGGVCSGIAAFLGIQDPIWVRLTFVLLTVSGGFGIPLYLILWAILPEAKTASDRLAMRGEPANVSNIGRIIEEEFSHVSKKMSELGEELKAEFSKKKSKKSHSQTDRPTAESNPESKGNEDDPTLQFRNAASEGVYFLSSAIKGIADVIAMMLRPLVYAVGIVLIVFMALFWIATVGMVFFGMPFTGYLAPEPHYLTTLGIFNVLFMVGIPILIGILLIMKLFLKSNFNSRWAIGLWIFWLVNVVSLFFVGTKTARDYSAEAEITLPVEVVQNNIDTLVLQYSDNPHTSSWMRLGDLLYISGDKLISTNIVLKVEKSESGAFEIFQQRSARGATPEMAQHLAESVQFNVISSGNTISIPSYYALQKGEKWRLQEVGLVVRVPVGKYIRFEGQVPDHNCNLNVDDNYEFSSQLSGYTLLMTSNGLVNLQYLKEDPSFHWMDGVTKVRAEGPMKFEILKGDVPLAHISDGEDYSEKVFFKTIGEELLVTTDYEADRPILIEIVVPSLSELSFFNTDDVEVQGFDLTSLTLRSNGEQEIRGDFNAQELQVELGGEVKMRLQGVGQRLDTRLSGEAKFDAEDYHVSIANVFLTDNSFARLAVLDTLYQTVGQGCSLEVLLDPVVVNR